VEEGMVEELGREWWRSRAARPNRMRDVRERERSRFVPGILRVKDVTGAFDYSTETHWLCKIGELAEKGFSHILTFSNLKESYGWGNTHTHAWVYKCISH
jgi:hypothetical protein